MRWIDVLFVGMWSALFFEKPQTWGFSNGNVNSLFCIQMNH